MTIDLAEIEARARSLLPSYGTQTGPTLAADCLALIDRLRLRLADELVASIDYSADHGAFLSEVSRECLRRWHEERVNDRAYRLFLLCREHRRYMAQRHPPY